MCYAAIVCFGLCPCQHNGTYTRNVHPATPTKKPAQILRFAESKKEPLSRKILGKAAQKALGKGTGPSNLLTSLYSGDDVKTVQANLGHATAQFTLDVYGHVTQKMRQESAMRMQAFYNHLEV